MKKILLSGLALSLVVISSGAAFADVIWDYSPGTYSAGTIYKFGNFYPSEYFGEKVIFSTGATVTGIDIYSESSVALETSVTVRLWQDLNGGPGLLINEIPTTISVVDTDGAGTTASITRKHADFSSLQLIAGTNYWIGMSGDSVNLGQTGISGIQDSKMANFSGVSIWIDYYGDMAFRLEGTTGNTPGPVPEPTTMLLFGAGIAGLAAVSRRKRS